MCGISVALAGIETSLGLDANCEVIGHTMPMNKEELCELHPDVVIFELKAFTREFIFAISEALPGVLLIGIDLETNRAMLWSEQRVEGWTSQDLSKAIHKKHFSIPEKGREA